jgi:hypothetical protein
MKKMNRVIIIATAFSFITAAFTACTNRRDPLPANIVKTWSAIPMNAAFEVPAPPGRNEEGEATLQLFDDNSLTYSFHIHNLSTTDNLVAAHIHTGDAGTSGPVFINLNPSFSGAGAEGKVTGLRQGQVDTLMNMPVYINVHSTQVASGVIRGQLDKNITLAKDIVLSGLNERPNAVNTSATGLAIIRLTDDKTLYSKVIITNIEANDTVTVSHIHKGGRTVPGPVRIFLCGSEADFGQLKTVTLVDSLYNILMNDSVYVNAHSRRKPGGLVRGQIR